MRSSVARIAMSDASTLEDTHFKPTFFQLVSSCHTGDTTAYNNDINTHVFVDAWKDRVFAAEPKRAHVLMRSHPCNA
jgi:hypothetical protein